MQDPKPATFNTVPNETEGTTWELPTGAIARLGKGFQQPYQDDNDIALSPNNTYFAVGTRAGLWWYDVHSMSPIALWETERGIKPNLFFKLKDVLARLELHSSEL